ncbi:pyridoxal 5'-phosphate synthase lyase subunit PdxS, partial [Mycobacterium tuberculosis]|nr:pyridoxal 5'-phosphate synthase lyase subunit PdxS [Mycobacterium tuberculosis]
AALVRQLGAEAVFVGSGIFMSDSTTFAEPAEAERRARAIVRATTHFANAAIVAECAAECQGAMKGLAVAALDAAAMLQTRGW